MDVKQLCKKCKVVIDSEESVHQCDVCLQYIHKMCVELSSSELKCMPLQKRILVFMCDSCLVVARKIP